MIFSLTEDQKMIREMVRRFAADAVLPVAFQWSEEGTLPPTIFEELHQLGLMGATVPADFGGSELDAVSFALVLEELGRADASLAVVVASHDAALETAGEAAAEIIEVGGVATVAHRGVVTGTQYSEWVATAAGPVALARAEPFDAQGLRAAGLATFSGEGHAPDSWLAWNAAIAVGVARGALEEAVAYAGEREQFGKPIAAYQAIQFKLADMATRVDAARLLVLSAASGATSVASALLFAAQTAEFVTDEAVQIHGGYGYTREYPVERYYRDARWFALVADA